MVTAAMVVVVAAVTAIMPVARASVLSSATTVPG